MSNKAEWPEGFIPEKRATMLYVVGIVIGAAAGFAVANVFSMRKPAVKVTEYVEMPHPCHKCEEEARRVAAASAQLSEHAPLHLAGSEAAWPEDERLKMAPADE